jgi:hypothetical protein
MEKYTPFHQPKLLHLPILLLFILSACNSIDRSNDLIDLPLIPETGVTANSQENVLPAEAPEAVGQWEIFEIILSSDKIYSNPFTDVDVFADFSHQNDKVRVYGFYDGDGAGNQGNLWRIRFSTGEIGAWSWKTSSTDPDNGGLNIQSGVFQVTKSTQPGPIQPDTEYPNAWRHANGDYFYWNLGYSIQMLGADRKHPGVGGWQDYLDWLDERGFNGVMFTLQVPGFQTCTTCAKGVAPWSAIGTNPPPEYAFNRSENVYYYLMPWVNRSNPNQMTQKSNETDFSRFYLPYWTKVDEILIEMQNKEMIAHIFQYDDETFWPPASSPEEYLYWDYIIRRLGGYWNVVFNDGIDLFEYRNVNNWVDEWQKYFNENSPFDNARSSRHGNDDSVHATWRSVQAANSSKPSSINEWRNLMTKSPRKPVTEDDGIRARKDSGISPDRFTQLAWWSVLSGSGGFGATWAGPYEPGNWYSKIISDSEGMSRVSTRIRFIRGDYTNGKSIPFWKLEVNDQLTNGSNVYSATVPGELYLVYFDFGASKTIEMDLTGVKEPLLIGWINPLNGNVLDGGISKPNLRQNFTNPFNGPAVLYIGKETIKQATSANLKEAIYLPLLLR